MRFRRAAVVLLLVFSVLGFDAAPAAAHGVGGIQPTNARSRVLSITPAVAGLTVEIIENGTRVELRNTSDAQVIVSGYEGEPYLRVGPDGVFRNVRSPATFLNRTSTPPARVPASYDATAEPEWRKVSSAKHVRWHDHRAHAMSSGPFATTQWTIPLTVDGRPVVVSGDLTWVEPGAWWPWLLLTFGIAVLIIVTARAAWRLTIMCTLALMVWAEALHVIGSWSQVASTTPGRISAQLISFAALALGCYALARASRDAPDSSAPFVLLAAVVFIVAGGIGDITAWTRSQLPSTLPNVAVRASVALALGGGGGLVVATARRLAPAMRKEAGAGSAR
jgi:hypothetical protein